MSSKYPVVVYGISGYTGKLIAEFLTRRRISFIAAGRSAARIAEALREVPGDHVCEIREVAHDEAALTALFDGAKMVVNVVGPFGQLGEPVVKAALAVGAHYLDTTGEQDWGLLLRDRYGRAFAERGLLLCPALSFMWTGGMIAAEIALEDPAITQLEILYVPRALPTIASTLSFLRMLCLPNPMKQYGQITAWPDMTQVEVNVPGTHIAHIGLPWGGGFEPIWLEHDQRVLNCQVLVAFQRGPLVSFILEKMKEYYELAKTHSTEEMERITNAWGNAIASTPPKEIPALNTGMISCWARGTTHGRHIALYNTSPYRSTGALVAEGCKRILNGQLRGIGFQAATRAFGHRELMAALAEDGLHCHAETLA